MRRLEAGSWWNEGMRDVAALLLKQARLPRTGLMLDVGCGSGQTITWFTQRHSSWRAIGLDVAGDAVVATHEEQCSVARASALALPLPDRCVGLAITLDVVQHLPLDGGDDER